MSSSDGMSTPPGLTWGPSPRPLPLTSPFLHSWNRTGSVMLREGWLCSPKQVEGGLFKISMCQEMMVTHAEDLGPMYCGFVYSGSSWSPTSSVFHSFPCLRAALHPCRHLAVRPPDPPPRCEWLRLLATSSQTTSVWSGYNKSVAFFCWY